MCARGQCVKHRNKYKCKTSKCLTVSFYGNLSIKNKNRLQKIVKEASKIIGMQQRSLSQRSLTGLFLKKHGQSCPALIIHFWRNSFPCHLDGDLGYLEHEQIGSNFRLPHVLSIQLNCTNPKKQHFLFLFRLKLFLSSWLCCMSLFIYLFMVVVLVVFCYCHCKPNFPSRDNKALNWTELNWTELNWTELNWTELNWTELKRLVEKPQTCGFCKSVPTLLPRSTNLKLLFHSNQQVAETLKKRKRIIHLKLDKFDRECFTLLGKRKKCLNCTHIKINWGT